MEKLMGVDAIYSNSHVDAGNTLTLQSGGDANLKVAATIGGNLNLESLQDTSTYNSKQSSTGVSLSIPIMGAGLNASRAKATGDYASVIEQTGIQAGDQGFNTTTRGNTDLKGAIIASTSKSANDVGADGKTINQLTTGTLIYSTIKNHTEASAKSDGINLTQDLLSKYGAARTALSTVDMHLNENESRSSVTQSAIEQGLINITSTQTVAKNISEDNALTISRDTQNSNQPLVKLDAKALEAQADKDAQQRAADVGLVTRVTDDAYRVMFREPPRFYKATC